MQCFRVVLLVGKHDCSKCPSSEIIQDHNMVSVGKELWPTSESRYNYVVCLNFRECSYNATLMGCCKPFCFNF